MKHYQRLEFWMRYYWFQINGMLIDSLTYILATILWQFPLWRERFWVYRELAWRQKGSRHVFSDFVRDWFFVNRS